MNAKAEIMNIVLAYDGSQGSQRALEWVVILARQLGAKVTAVTVVKPPEYSPTIDEVDEFYADGERHYRPLLTKVVEFGLEQGLTIKTEILRGHPAESIVKYAYDQKADLIVTGTRGMGGFKNLIIGSVAQKVVTYSKVPVLVIK
jgi:nucleotide-binding universal stress UspA family protein